MSWIPEFQVADLCMQLTARLDNNVAAVRGFNSRLAVPYQRLSLFHEDINKARTRLPSHRI